MALSYSTMKMSANTGASGEPIATLSFRIYVCSPIKTKVNTVCTKFNQFFHFSFNNCCVSFFIIVNPFQNNIKQTSNGRFVTSKEIRWKPWLTVFVFICSINCVDFCPVDSLSLMMTVVWQDMMLYQCWILLGVKWVYQHYHFYQFYAPLQFHKFYQHWNQLKKAITPKLSQHLQFWKCYVYDTISFVCNG